MHYRSGLTALILAVFVQTSFGWVTGRVVDDKGTAVPDAMVSYTDLDNRLIYVYTNSDGQFAIPAPDEWSVKDLPMYRDPTRILHSNRLATNRQSTGVNAVVQNGSLLVSLSAESQLNIDLYDLHGRLVHQVFSGTAHAGQYRVDPFGQSGDQVAAQSYLVRLTTPHTSRSLRLTRCGTKSLFPVAAQPQTAGHQRSATLTRVASVAAIDEIRAGKTNYLPALKPIDTYHGEVGTLVITLRDIESEINTIIAGKDRWWKAGQCTQGVDSKRNGEWGTFFFSWSHNQAWEVRANTLDGIQRNALETSGIPQMFAIDAVHGFSLQPPATIFPHNIGLGASRNGPLLELAQRVTAIECRAQGINWNFAPCIDIVRDERHGRTYEGFDEGPEGSATCAYYAVRGLQGSDLAHPMTIAATIKHFAGAGGTWDGKHATNANTADHPTLSRIHLPPFRAGCEAGAATVMAAFNQWLGTEMHLHKTLLTDTLKNSWKWDGFVTGDWDEATHHGPGNCLNAGVDNPMVPSNPTTARENYNSAGTDARLDDAARRILRVKLRLNLFDDPFAHRDYLTTIKSPGHIEVARECVRRSIVLLKNENSVLPLKRDARVHVVGQWADDMGLQCGGWTVSWQAGPNKDIPEGTSIYEGIKEVGTGTITYSLNAGNIPANADVIVVAVGELPYAESPGDKDPLYLTTEHQQLIQACVNAGKPVITILISGRPMVVTDEINRSTAFVAAFLPGTQGGGIADVLFNVNGEDFTARLSHTWPRSMEQIPINNGNYGDRIGSAGTPLFTYGFGLSYKN